MKIIFRFTESDKEKVEKILISTAAFIRDVLDSYDIDIEKDGTIVCESQEFDMVTEEQARKIKDYLRDNGLCVSVECEYSDLEKLLRAKEGKADVDYFADGDEKDSGSGEEDVSAKQGWVFDVEALVDKWKKAQADGKTERPEKEKLTFGQKQRNIAALKTALLGEVKGQQHAVDAFVRAFFGAETLVAKEHKGPLATFLFAGPPGCGKTYLSECASRFIKDRKFARFDMSEYGEWGASVNNGPIMGFVADNPNGILLFDEIEKASTANLRMFLQILDSGMIRTGMGKEVSFKDTILIFTTNVAKNLYDEEESGNLSGVSKSTIISALESDTNPLNGKPYFPRELVSRWAKGTVVLFNRLEPYALKEIVLKELESRLATARANTGLTIECDTDKIASLIMYSAGGAADARAMVGEAKRFVESELFDAVSQLTRRNMDVDALKKICIDVDYRRSPVRQLFEQTDKLPLLFAAESRYGKEIKRVSGKQGRIKVMSAQDLASAISSCDGEVGAVVLDVLLKEKNPTGRPSDLEDVVSVGVEIFEYLTTNHPDIPVYVLNDEERGFDDAEFDTFLARGAKGILHFRKDDDVYVAEQIEFVRSSTVTGNSFYKMAKGSYVLCYNCAQQIEDNGAAIRITVRRLEKKRAVRADDVNSLVADVSRPKTKFSDVVGATEVKEAMKACVDYLLNPKKFAGSGLKPPKGILLYGPPGTGKTMLAKALAGETDVAFIEKNGTEFFKKYVGEGPESIRKTFRTARKYAPAIIFIDEVDAFANKRSGSEFVYYREQLLTTFLSEMDGFKSNPDKPVILVCATNCSIKEGTSDSGIGGVLDPAFVRRFDRKILVGLPELDDRRALIRHFLRLCGADVSALEKGIDILAKKTEGYNNDALRQLIENLVKAKGVKNVTVRDLEEAYDGEEYGKEKKRSDEARLRTARHETGHAIVSWACGRIPSYVTIISRGDYGGYMMTFDENDITGLKAEILDRICCVLGGRAAELVYYGEEGGLSAGPSADLQSATQLAMRLVGNWGMSDGRLAVTDGFGDVVKKEVYDEVNAILLAQCERAENVIRKHKEAADKLAEALLEYNSIDGHEITDILGQPASEGK